MKEAVLLVYHMLPARSVSLSALCRTFGIRLVTVSDGEGKIPIGLLAQAGDPLNILNGSAQRMRSEMGPGIDEEMIVMAGFGEKLFSQFLSALRETGLRIDLKAVLTDENIYWSGEMLQEELKKEREAYRKAKGSSLER